MEINFKKKFGQNFLTDKNLLASIVSDAEISKDDVVLEIGAGAGALTEFLVKSAKKVVSFEIDKELMPILQEKFGYESNIEIIYEDFMNFNEEILLKKLGKNFKVVANLPYYITTAIISKLFSLKVLPKTIVVMVQKEVGERITADEKQSEYGYFSAYVRAFADAKIVRNVNRKMFVPAPNVDSCIVKMTMKENKYPKEFLDFLKQCFVNRRKTLANNLSTLFDKQHTSKVLIALNLNPSARADSLSVEALYQIYCKL